MRECQDHDRAPAQHVDVGGVRGKRASKDGEDTCVRGALAGGLALGQAGEDEAALGLQRLLALAAQHHADDALKAAEGCEDLDKHAAVGLAPSRRRLGVLAESGECSVRHGRVRLAKLAQRLHRPRGVAPQHTLGRGQRHPATELVHLGRLLHVGAAAVHNEAAVCT